MRRCPFLARVSQAFLQKAGPSLLLYAQHCPRMMEASPPAAARALATSAARGQQAEEETPTARPGEYGRRGATDRAGLGGGAPGWVPERCPKDNLSHLYIQISDTEGNFWNRQLQEKGCLVPLIVSGN